MLTDCRTCVELFSNMADSLLSEDAFNSDQSQKLFEVIDELHSCGAKAYVDLPEVACWHFKPIKTEMLIVTRLLLLAINLRESPLSSKA